MDNKIYKVGIIGFGGMAGHHANQLSKGNTRAVVKGVYDIREDRLKVAEERGLVAYPTKEALLSDPEIDIVLVATPNDSHCSLSIEAMAAGKHVMCEKPVTMSSAELLEIMEASNKYNKVFTIDQNRRVNRDYVLMRTQIESGAIGRPYLIESRVEGSRGIPEGWREVKAQGGGMMLDWGVHLIDQILYMTDKKVINVFCKMYMLTSNEVDDNFQLLLTLEGGLNVQIEVSTNNFIQHPRWMVFGTEGTLQIDDWSSTGKIITCLDKENKWDDDIKLTNAGPSKTMSKRSESSVRTIPLTAPEGVNDTVEPSWNQLISAIEGGELTITPEQALRVMRVMEAAFESNAKGIAVATNI